MKKIAVVTATRAEYGLLAPVVRELRNNENDRFQVDLIVTGTHLSAEYGMTIRDIEDRIDYTIPISVKSDDSLCISGNQADALVKFTRHLETQRYDAVILLGDRYETLAIAISAGNTKTPIFHLCGGDTTEGAIDEWIRHSITKMSYLHFVTNEDSRKRVIQLGEEPGRVYNYGSTSIDNIITMANMTKEEALDSIGLSKCRFALCTYHPVTMDNDKVEEQVDNVLNAIRKFPDIEFIITKSNADQGGAKINELLDKAAGVISNIHVFDSLGVRRYLSLMKHAELVLGNSSSGIIETPAFHIPTVNIGDRQRGRLQADSIVNCEPTTESICKAIDIALSDKHKKVCLQSNSPYGVGNAAEQIAKKTIEVLMKERIDLKKKFFDLNIV